MKAPYEPEPSEDAVKQLQGPAVIEFGANWCGFCKAAQPHIEAAFASHIKVHHVKVEDGKGKRLGRTFGVKLWPTLIFLRDGVEVTRVVRPEDEQSVSEGLAKITSY